MQKLQRDGGQRQLRIDARIRDRRIAALEAVAGVNEKARGDALVLHEAWLSDNPCVCGGCVAAQAA